MDLQNPSLLQAELSCLLPELAFHVLHGLAVEAVLDEMEVQGLNKRSQSSKLEMMLCIEACYREKYPNFGLSFKTFRIHLHLFTTAEPFLILFSLWKRPGQGEGEQARNGSMWRTLPGF